MSVYLYAICGANAAAPEVPDFDGAPLRMVRGDRLSALVSDRAAPQSIREQELWEHERVVETLMELHNLVPVRFGTVLGSDAAVAELLAARSQELAAALEFVAGSAELGVRVAHPSVEPDDERPRSGYEYFAERLRVRQRVGALVTRIEGALSPLAKASRIRIPATPGAAVVGAFLVAHERIDEFAHRVDALDLEIATARVFCTGPWPPYSFSDAWASTP